VSRDRCQLFGSLDRIQTSDLQVRSRVEGLSNHRVKAHGTTMPNSIADYLFYFFKRVVFAKYFLMIKGRFLPHELPLGVRLAPRGDFDPQGQSFPLHKGVSTLYV
jgi:hypothetical protein